MKKVIRTLSFVLVASLLLSVLPLSGIAYGADNQKLIITHINVGPNNEGSALVAPGSLYPKLGSLGTFAWWKAIIFDWDADEKCYKVVSVYTNSNNSDKSAVEIPSTGFVYGICIGNNYPGGIQYRTQRVIDSCNYITTANIPVGTKAYLYNADLENGIINSNGKTWYAADYESYSYIKLGTSDSGEQAYNPEESHVLGYDIIPTEINEIVYSNEHCLLMTESHGDYIKFGSGKYQWWSAAVFDWDDSQGCYVVASVSRIYNNSAIKQPIIPKNGFAIVTITINATSMSNLKEGAKCWLYDINLKNGTLGSNPTIRVNVPYENRVSYAPDYTDPRLTTPEVNEGATGLINTTSSGLTLTWDAINGADGYMVAVAEADINPDGELLVTPEKVTTNSYAFPAELLSVGRNYTFWIYACGDGYTPSMVNKYTVKCVSENAMNTSLKDKKIIAFGDSLTERTGYVNMLYNYLGCEVVNAGVGGNSTYHARARFETDVLDRNPDIVLICFGMNDQAAYHSGNLVNQSIIALSTYRDNLAYFAKTLTEKGVDVVFVTPNPVCTEAGYYSPGSYNLNYGYGHMDSFCNAMREVAAEYGCGLVDINYECDFEDLKKFLNAGDGIHQSLYGHERYAELISDYLYAAYDDADKAVMTLNAKDADGNIIKTYTYTGKVGSHITIASPKISNYVTSDADVETVFVDKASFTMNYVAETLVPKDGSNYAVDPVSGLITAVLPATKASDFNSSFTSAVTVLDKTGKALAANAIVGTGCTISYDSAVYKVIILGELSGDGVIDIVDYSMMKRIVLDSFTPDEFQIKAGSITNGESIQAVDYAKVKRHVLGTLNIFAD